MQNSLSEFQIQQNFITDKCYLMAFLHMKGEPASSDLLLLVSEYTSTQVHFFSAVNYLSPKNYRELNFNKKLITLLTPETVK